MRIFVEAVRGEDLAEDEEGGHGSMIGVLLELLRGIIDRRGGGLVFEDDVVAAEGPAVIAGVEMVAEGQDTPY